MIRAHSVAGPCIERAVRAWPTRLADNELFGPAGLSAMSGDPLLGSLLENAQVCDPALERFLTMVRRAMLDAALDATIGKNPDASTLAFHCALARQCFLNEYAFADSDDERAHVAVLKGKVIAALEGGDDIPALWIVAPQHVRRCPLWRRPRRFCNDRAGMVSALLVQQIAEPAEEKRLRDAMCD
jgi:hypothetical protein